MTIATITIGNDSTQYTIDTYGTFDQDSETLYLLENMVEDGELKSDFTWDDYEAEYDHKGYVEELSRRSFDHISELFKNSPIIKTMELGKSFSPREYNFKTDSYDLTIEYDLKELADFIAQNDEAYRERFANEWTSRDGFMSFCELYDELTCLVFYLDSEYDEDQYWEDMTRDMPGAEYITVTIKENV